MSLRTEYDFTLPRGYVDEDGVLHQTGKMRLATAADEVLPLKDPRVQQNPAYLSIILMARVITNLGTMRAIDTKVIEKLFTPDIAYLQSMYQRINAVKPEKIDAICPGCSHKFKLEVPITLGE